MPTFAGKTQRRRSVRQRLQERTVRAKVTDPLERRKILERATTRIKTTARVDTVETS